MGSIEKRTCGRVGTCNLISFVILDDQGNQVGHGMGKAVDISQSGLRLLTTHPVSAERVSLMATDMDGQLVEITGRMVFSRRGAAGGYQAGVEFTAPREARVRFATSLIKAFHYGRSRPASEDRRTVPPPSANRG